MRQIKQPGPLSPIRIESCSGALIEGEIDLKPGAVLMDAVSERLTDLGLRSAALDLSGIALGPFHFVMPAHSSSGDHVAFYSETFQRPGPIEIDEGTATYGSRDGAPFLHGHLFWREDGGRQAGGHLLPAESRVARAAKIGFRGCREVAMTAAFDPETNFTLFGPVAEKEAAARDDGDLIVARIRPNEDLIGAIAEVCRRHHVATARICSLIGSLVGGRFEDGSTVDKVPTEILGLEGRIERQTEGGYRVDLDLALIDVDGKIHRGRPCRGDNPVLICVELFLERC